MEENNNMSWMNDDSWSFPILVDLNNEDGGFQNGGKLFNLGGGSGGTGTGGDGADNKGKGKEVMLMPPPPPRPPAAKKRTASAGAGGSGSKSGGVGDKKAKDEEKGGQGGETAEHEQHIWTERERRKKMRDMFSNLHALIPHLPARTDKATIVDEAVGYIKKLQQNLTELQKRKEDKINLNSIPPNNQVMIPSREAFLAAQGTKSTNSSAFALANPNNTQNVPSNSAPEFPALFKTWTSPNVILNVCGPDAHINVCGPKKPGMFTAICFVLNKYKLEIVSAQVSSDRGRRMYMIHTHAHGGCEQFAEAVLLVEEVYKQAAAEIMLWVTS